MQLNLIFGAVFVFVAFYYGNIVEILGGSDQTVLLNAFIFVVVGTLASSFISTSFKMNTRILQALSLLIYNKSSIKPIHVVQKLVKISEVSQSSSKQDLAKYGSNFGDGFLERGLELIGDGLEKDFIQRTLETDIIEIQRRHGETSGAIRRMGSFAPMFGMMGTVLGVIEVLKNVTNVDMIVAGMSLALLTTLYGLILSSVVFIPLANKLQNMSDNEIIVKQIMLEGLLAIIDKEIPLKVEKYLLAFVAGKDKKNKKKK